MDLRLTNNELEIKHASKEDVVETINAIESLICFKLNLPYPLANIPLEPKMENPLDSLLDAPVEDLQHSVTNNTEEVEKPVETTHHTIKIYEGKTSAPKKRLVFDTCDVCGETFCQMTEIEGDLAPTLGCKCGHVQHAYDLTKGSYECDCGQKGFFLITPGVNVIKCKNCKKDFLMTLDSETEEYVGHPID